jgi:uncharacterized repeat protein (TIGR01451 family)
MVGTRSRWRIVRALPVVALLMIGMGATSATAGAGAASARGVQPVVMDTGNSDPRNECRTLTGIDTIKALQVAGESGGFPGGSPYTDGTLTVTISDWDAQDKTFDWASNIPVLGVWVKGGSGGEGNWYDYAAFSDQPPKAGADHDGELHPKDNPNGVAGLSHVTFCYAKPGGSEGSPDIEVQKSSDAGAPLHPGDTITYTIVVTNVGDATAHDITVQDELPAGVHPVDGLPDLSGATGSCTAAGSSNSSGEEHYSITCQIDELAAGDHATITAQVEVDEDAACGDLINVVHAEAEDESGGAVDSGNDDSVTDEVACTCGVTIEKTASPTSGDPGDTITYRYVVTNTGNEAAQVTVTDDLLGDVGTDVLQPGAHTSFEMQATLPTSGAAVVNVATVVAETDTGERCTARDDATVTIVSAGGGGQPPGGNGGEQPPGGGGTAFTGPADLPIAALVILATIGLAAIVVARRGRGRATG